MAVKAEESVTKKNVSQIEEKPAENEPEKIDENKDQVERDESLAEIDENVVELDYINPATDKTPDKKVTFPAGVKLFLEDYPYAKDGTEIWGAIETWVRGYCDIFYGSDEAVEEDKEIKEWWSEIRNVGHRDQKEGWYDLTTSENLVKALTTLIWITSGLHAAVNFGQYAYAGWPLNRPMLLRKFIPKEDSQEEEEEMEDPGKFIDQMFPEKFQMAFVIAVMDLLSRHTSDEEIKEWCEEAFKQDEEIKEWWSEIRKVGHGDQKEGWYELTTSENLVKALTTIIWITSGLHAAVNFGQYAYAGWPPNRPMLLRKFIPKQDSPEEKELFEDSDKFIAQMFPQKFQMEFVIAVMDLLSRHTSDEVYLGQRPPENKWEENEDVNKKFQDFRRELEEIEKKIMGRNKDYNLMNRWGNAKIPYKLLYPDTSKKRAPTKEKMDINGRGIPNSISI